jgi:sugar/nucleoside kinase (ribokinase family)
VTDVVCLGILVADAIARPVDEVPPRGALELVDEISLHGGGCALNTASALVRLGLDARVVGKVGADPFGDFILQLLDERGVDRRGVLQDSAVSTSATVVLVDSDVPPSSRGKRPAQARRARRGRALLGQGPPRRRCLGHA